ARTRVRVSPARVGAECGMSVRAEGRGLAGGGVPDPRANLSDLSDGPAGRPPGPRVPLLRRGLQAPRRGLPPRLRGAASPPAPAEVRRQGEDQEGAGALPRARAHRGRGERLVPPPELHRRLRARGLLRALRG